MRTTTPLTHTSPPSARKPALKRRRLNHAVEPGFQPSRALTDNSNAPSTQNATSWSQCGKLSCATCHRALSTATRPGVASPSMCSRCSAPTCAICARTCTSYTRPPSFPPTPALTRSPSPSAHTLTPVSPKRAALSLSYFLMNCDISVPPLPLSVTSTKRKKAPVDKEDGDGDLDGNAVRDHSDALSTYSYGGTVVIPGCGRVVCRACCVESVPNDGKLCVDCFALV